MAMKTKTFKSGNSQAVRIPAPLAYDDIIKDLEITRSGDVITIQPVRGSLREAVELLRQMPKPDTVEEIDRIELPDREWD